ncbi:MAG: glutathione S-transferase [Gammaproteobacteria bacterium]|nr:glutathione S-transferase [Gammaproteobacteria bacterium]
MTDLVLYTNPQSRGRIAHWMLEELGRPYETVWIEFGPPMREGAYLDINPMGKVPALKHGDLVVTETPAICAYLADCFPEAGLMPPAGDPARAAYYRWMFFAAGPLETAITAKALDWTVPKGKSGLTGFGSYEKTLEVIEGALKPGPYICGERFTAADVYVGSQLSWGMRFGMIDKRLSFEAYVARLNDRPAARNARTIAEEQLKKTQP